MARTSTLLAAVLAAHLLGAGSATAEWGGGYGGTPGGSSGSGYGGSSGGTWGGNRGSGGGTWGGNRGSGGGTWGGNRGSGGGTWGGGQAGYGGGNADWGGGRPGYGGGRGPSNCYYCRANTGSAYPNTYPVRPRPPVWNRGGYPVGYGRPPVERYLGGY